MSRVLQSRVRVASRGMAISYADTARLSKTTGNILASNGARCRTVVRGWPTKGQPREHLLFVHGTTACYVTCLAGTITRVDNVIGALHGKRSSWHKSRLRILFAPLRIEAPLWKRLKNLFWIYPWYLWYNYSLEWTFNGRVYKRVKLIKKT